MGQGWSLTEQVPLRKESRLRHTGNRISMLLKFRHFAEARAHASADWGGDGDVQRLGQSHFVGAHQ